MARPDIKLLAFTVKLIALVIIAFAFITVTPQHAHYLLLVIAATLCFLGSKALLHYKAQSRWIEKKATVKSLTEREEVSISQYAKIKYYYPEIEYEYTVNGVRHLASTVSLEKENIWLPEINNWGDPIQPEKKWWLAVKPGDELPVFINPLNEYESVLINIETKSRKSHHLSLIVSGVLLALIWLILENNK